jgi:hypothetical protein
MLYMMRDVALPNMCQAKRWRAARALLLLSALGCARTGLYPGDLDDDVSSATGGRAGEGPSGSGGSQAVVGGAQALPQPTSGTPSAGSAPQPPACEPAAEICNGRDDDCNGAVDDALKPEPCPGGGSSFCVAGRMSECPKRCEVCVPGSVRICQNPFCTFWGEQECAADGQGFGYCREANPPPECAGIARKHQQSPQLEQCCLDNGYCCLDEHDLDADGDRREMLGACGDVACQ